LNTNAITKSGSHPNIVIKFRAAGLRKSTQRNFRKKACAKTSADAGEKVTKIFHPGLGPRNQDSERG